MINTRFLQLMALFTRFALAAAFLSAVADRFGLWGAKGEPGVSWGSIEGFMPHVALLCPWAPPVLIPTVAWGVTGVEVLLAIMLVFAIRLRETALATFALLIIFALSMAAFQSIKLMLNFSVLSAAACAGLLYLAVPVIEARRAKTAEPALTAGS